MKLKNNKKNQFILILFLITSSFLFAKFSYALNTKDFVDMTLGNIAQIAVSVSGTLVGLVINSIISIAQYNEFISQPQIIEAWKIVRDFCNMLFILVLLMIAFASILRLENYSMKRWLPKVVIMAVLINFSRIIVGILIDGSQIVMLTFVDSFSAGGGNFVAFLQIDQYLTILDNTTKVADLRMLSIAYILATIFSIIALITMLAILIVFVMRVIYLWIYVALSPLAFLMMAFPGGQKYASEYWGELTKYLLNGPVLAFFIWLALSALNQLNNLDFVKKLDGGTAILEGANFMSFVLAIAFLVGGLMKSSEIGGKGASWGYNMAGRVKNGSVNWANKKATGLAVRTRDRSVTGLKTVGGAVGGTVGRVGLAGVGTVDRVLGNWVNKMPKVNGRLGTQGFVGGIVKGTLNTPSKAIGSIRNWLREGDENAKKSRDATTGEDASGVFTNKDGKKYKANADNVYEDMDSGETYKDSKGKEVKRMNAWQVAAHDAWNAANGKAQGARNRVEEEEINKKQKDISDSNMTTEEMLRMFNDGATSRDTKLALAMTLAIKKGFKTKEEIDKADDMLGGNSIMSAKFKDEVDKNQAHLAYDLTDPNGADAAKFKKRVDQGKIDTTKMDSDAYKDKNVLRTLDDYHGKDFKRVMETVYKRGKKYETSVSDGLLNNRDASNVSSNNLSNDKSAKLHARLTGRVEESFMGTSSYDYSALGQYVSSAKPSDLNKANAKDLKTSFWDPSVKNSVVNNMSYGKLKSMHKTGENPELVKLIKDAMIAANKDAVEINGDAELRSL